MIGGLIIGLGGLVEPRALGVGYGTIHAELLGQLGLVRPGPAVRREAASSGRPGWGAGRAAASSPRS